MNKQNSPATFKTLDLKTLVTLAMLAAIAYIVMFFFRIPISTVDFLKYDPKDVVIVVAGFLYDPLPAFFMSLVVSLIEMVTVSSTGPIGMVMNVLATCAFACTASFIYKRRPTLPAAVVGLAAGAASMTGVMLLWNWLITPMYMGYPREAVTAMLLPVFLPFNLLKSGINAALAMLLYKPLVTALRKSGLVAPARANAAAPKHRASVGVLLAAAALLASCVLLVLVIQGVI